MTQEFRAFIKTFHEETIRLFGPRIPESPRQEFIRETQRLNSIHDAYCFLELGTSYYFKETPPRPWGGDVGGARARPRIDEQLATFEEDLKDLRKLVNGKKVIVRNLFIPPRGAKTR